jgi:hypothetical protein
MVHFLRKGTGPNTAESASIQELARIKRTEIVQGSRRGMISISFFVQLLGFNRQRSEAISILAGRRVTRICNMSKAVFEVEVLAIAAARGGCAVFLGNEERVS